MRFFRRIALLFRVLKALGHFHLINGRKYVEYPNGQIRRGDRKIRHGRSKESGKNRRKSASNPR